MKKVLCLLTFAVTVLALCLTLSACSCDETATTTTPADTTLAPVVTTPVVTTKKSPGCTEPPESKPVVTTPVTTTPATTTPVTTSDNTPVELEPTSISYSMSLGGYVYTQFDEAGRTSVRYVYDRETMQKTGREYRYTYGADGKLTSFCIDISDESMEYTVTYLDDGKTAIATYVKNTSDAYRITFDENGKILSEETLSKEDVVFAYEYNADGYIVMETMYFRGTAIEYETVYDEDMALIVCELPNAATELTVIYNEAGYPISLEGTQLNTEYWHAYTYNKKMLCSSANFIDGNYEFYYIFTYDEKDRLKMMIEESDEGLHEEQYAYDDNDLLIRLQVSDCAHSGELNYFYVTIHEYDDKGRVVKTVSYEDGDETEYSQKWTYTFVYNEADLVIEETATFTTSGGGFIADFKDYYEYDEAGREIKFTMIEFDEKGKMINKTVTEYEYDEDGELVKETVSRYDDKGNLTNQDVTDYTE